MGNPPFGHSGERAISAYFAEGNGKKLQEKILNEGGRYEDFLHFEGNANAMRLLTHQFIGRRKGGLCPDIQHACLHHQISVFFRLRREERKFGFFQSEEEAYLRIANELGISREPGRRK